MKKEEKYKFTEEMGEISGFGGSYEECCRKMLKAGLRFLDDNQKLIPSWKGFEGVFGFLESDNEGAEQVDEAIINACDHPPTSAMHHAVVQHLLYVKKHGWDEYVDMMKGDEEYE